MIPDHQILWAVLGGLSLVLTLIIYFKVPAFIALLIASIATAILAGQHPAEVIDIVQEGMGSTLGFVATVVGLGAMFGGILEKTNSAQVIAHRLLRMAGERRAPLALMVTGFIVAIPVFFDVGFIILFPIMVALHRKSGISLLYYAVPLLAGLAVTHACIPPTPGPMAVASIIGAPLGWVIALGAVIGLPMALSGGHFYGKYIGSKIDVQISEQSVVNTGENIAERPFRLILWILLVPIKLMILSSLAKAGFLGVRLGRIAPLLELLGHPFVALLLANLLAWVLLGRRRGMSAQDLSSICAQSIRPVGMIILVTGAGGVYKSTLIHTGAGQMIAESVQSWGLSLVLFAFLAALLVRLMQGSATVAMITAGGLVAPLLPNFQLSDVQLAALVISISSGATAASHFNDSGFWLVKEYLGISEKQALASWTVSSSIIGLVGGVLSTFIYLMA